MTDARKSPEQPAVPAKFKAGQIVVMKSLKRQLPFRVLEVREFDGHWMYRWNRNNWASEGMVRALTAEEAGFVNE